MAYKIMKREPGFDPTNGYYTEYLCESADDIATLPTEVENGGPRPGSLAFIESDSGARYILKINREWGEYPMSNGGGGSTGSGVLSIGMTVGEEYATLDKTWQEIFNHCSAGGFAVVVFAESDLSVQTLPVSEVNSSGSGLFFVYANALEGGAVETNSFSTESADGYPSMSIGG